MRSVVSSTVVGMFAGFLSRPCCAVPMVLSLTSIGGAGLAGVVMTWRPALLAFSAATVVASVWLTFRREGGWFNRCLSMAAAAVGFVAASRFLGMF
jgi:hypothetical protein